MKDYYSILGVQRGATDDEIKQAFRRLAMKHHPDRGGDQLKFQDINEAYGVLGDPQKRAEYDNPHRGRVHVNMGGPHFNFDDIFSMFGASFGQRQSMARMQLWISLADVAQGGPRVISVADQNGQSNIEIQIPPGIDDGDSIRYPGMAPGGHDLIITYRVRPDARWQRDGSHVITDITVDILDLIVGGEIIVSTLTNTELTLKIPPMTQPGTMMRIRNHGLQRKNTHQKGDLLVRVQARLPDKISDELMDAIRQERGQ